MSAPEEPTRVDLSARTLASSLAGRGHSARSVRLGPEPVEAERFDRYTAVSEINRGGMGAILRATDPDTNRDVALKTLRAAGRASERATQMFLTEGQVTAQLEHPNIVPIHEVDRTASGELYISMKLVRGEDLAQVLAADAWSQSRLLAAFLKICDAVAFAHDNGVVHRDLKPANVMVGEFGEVLVMDWGLAKVRGVPDRSAEQVTLDTQVLGDRDSAELRTVDGSVMGTPAYMPPEQAAGEIDRIDARSDVYALGAILYEILTLQVPYHGSPISVLDKVVEGKLVPPIERAPERAVPRELNAVVMRAMAASPDDRYASVIELQADVERFLHGRIVEAARYGPLARAGKWLQRNKVAVAVCVVLAVGLALGRVALDQSSQRHVADVKRDKTELDVAKAEEAKRVALALESLKTEIASARPYRYIADIDLQQELRSTREALASVVRLSEDPRYSSAELWQWRGQAALFLGDDAEAERSLLRAVELGLPRSRVAAALIHVFRRQWMLAFVEGQHDAARDLLDIGEPWLVKIRPRLAEIGTGKLPALRVAFYEALALLAEKDAAGTRRRLIAAWKIHRWQLGSEELLMLATLYHTRGSDRMRKACLDVTSRCPQHGMGHLMLATYWMDKQQPEKALAPYDQAILIFPKLAIAHIGRAAARWRTGDKQGAIEDLARALELDPDHVQALGNRSAMRSLLGDRVSSAADLARAEKIEPRSAQLHEQRAAILAHAGDAAGAEAAFRRAAALRPDRAFPWIWLGRLCLKRDDGQGGLRCFDKALQCNPRSVEALLRRVNLRLKLGQKQLALADADRAVSLRSTRGDIFAFRASIRQQAGDYSGAVADLDKALSIDPANTKARGVRGVLFVLKKQYRKGLAELDQAIVAYPEDFLLWYQRGIARRHTGNLAGSLADLKRGLELAGNIVEKRLALLQRAEVRTLLGDFAGAVSDFSGLLAIDPRSARAMEGRGAALSRLRQFQRALADFDRVIAIAPRSASAHAHRSSALRTLGQFDRALRDAQRAVELGPRIAHNWLVRGLAHLHKRKRNNAWRDFSQAIKLDPRNVEAYFRRGELYRQVRRNVEAQRDFEKVIALAPRDWRGHGYKGLVLATIGRKAEALALLRKAHGMAPPAEKLAIKGRISRLMKE